MRVGGEGRGGGEGGGGRSREGRGGRRGGGEGGGGGSREGRGGSVFTGVVRIRGEPTLLFLLLSLSALHCAHLKLSCDHRQPVVDHVHCARVVRHHCVCVCVCVCELSVVHVHPCK
jgi:hypothetical protein